MPVAVILGGGGLLKMKATFQNLFDSLKGVFTDAVVAVSYADKTADGIKTTPSINSALGFSMPDTPADGLSVMVKSSEIDECAPGDAITVGEFGHIVVSHSIDQVGAIRTIAVSQPFNKTATFTGQRREGPSGSRELFLSIPCMIYGGDLAGVQSGAIAPTSERNFMLVVRACDWSDSNPPHSGDAVEVTNYPPLKVVECVPVLGGWNVTCKTKASNVTL